MGCINCKPENEEGEEYVETIKQKNKCKCCICCCCIKTGKPENHEGDKVFESGKRNKKYKFCIRCCKFCKPKNDEADKGGESVKRKKKCKCWRKNGKVSQEDNTADELILEEVKPACFQHVSGDCQREYNLNQTKDAPSTDKCGPPKNNETVILQEVTENKHKLDKNKVNYALSEECEIEKKEETDIPHKSDRIEIQQAKRVYFDGGTPQADPPRHRHIKPPSLTNVGATCYLNSAFQGISACDTFVREINELCSKNEDVKQLHVFKALMDILNGCFCSRMEISHNPIFRDWNKPGQQDSYELLVYALNEVYNELRQHKESFGQIKKRDLQKWLQEKLPMRFIIQYTIVCGCGMVTKSPLQSDLALHVTIPLDKKESHLNDLIDLYFQEDPIEDYECDKKGCPGTGTTRVARLSKPLPRTICIHLQRTYWNGYSMVKINRNVVFRPTIKMKPLYWSDCPPEVPTKDSHAGGGTILEVAKEVDGGDRRSSHLSSDERMKSDIKDFDDVGLNGDAPVPAEEGNQRHEGECADSPTREIEIALMATDIVNMVIENILAEIEKGCSSLQGFEEEVITSKEYIRSEVPSFDHVVGDETKALHGIESELESRKLAVKNESEEMKEDKDEEEVNHCRNNQSSEVRPSIPNTLEHNANLVDCEKNKSSGDSLIITNCKEETNLKEAQDTKEQPSMLNNTFATTNGTSNPDISETGATGSFGSDCLDRETCSKFDHHSGENKSSIMKDSMMVETTTDIHNIGNSSRISNIKLDSEGHEQKERTDCGYRNFNVGEENKTIVEEQENMKTANDFKAKGIKDGIDKSAKDLIVLGSEALQGENIGGAHDDSVVEPGSIQSLKDEKYSLVSVIVHYGSVSGGHYICYKKVDGSWFLTDDSSVREVSEDDVLRCQAYILFYEQPYSE